MDRDVAAGLLRRELMRYCQRTYAELVDLVGLNDAYTVRDQDQTPYNVEVSISWDDRLDDTVRITGSVEDGRIGPPFDGPAFVEPAFDEPELAPLEIACLVHPDGTVEFDPA